MFVGNGFTPFSRALTKTNNFAKSIHTESKILRQFCFNRSIAGPKGSCRKIKTQLARAPENKIIRKLFLALRALQKMVFGTPKLVPH